MANNRLMICEVDDDLNIIKSVTIAKHFGGAWRFCGSNWPDRIDRLFEDAYFNHHGLALMDEYMEKPVIPVHYRDICERSEHEIDSHTDGEVREKVVRCRDCARFIPQGTYRFNSGVVNKDSCNVIRGFVVQIDPDGFCAWGERKSNV